MISSQAKGTRTIPRIVAITLRRNEPHIPPRVVSANHASPMSARPLSGSVVFAVMALLLVGRGRRPVRKLRVEADAGKLITPAADAAVEKGLAFLAASQHDDGSFASGGYRGNVAICGLAGLAFMAGGNTPGRGPVRRERLPAASTTSWFIPRKAGSFRPPDRPVTGRCTGMGLPPCFWRSATECRATRTSSARSSHAAVDLIVNTQNTEGGWRYQPRRLDADISVTICQVMALRAARNAGIEVPNETIDNCIEYVRRSQNPDGGFMYMVSGGESGFARSAAGVVALHSAGVYEGSELGKGIDYLMKFLPGEGQSGTGGSYYYYGHYYAVQAMWRQGGEPWQKWYPAIRDELIGRQRSDGSWMSPISPEYATAMSCIILQVPNNFLPILQR